MSACPGPPRELGKILGKCALDAMQRHALAFVGAGFHLRMLPGRKIATGKQGVINGKMRGLTMMSADRAYMRTMADTEPSSRAGIYEINPRTMLPYEAAAQVLTLLTFAPEVAPDAELTNRVWDMREIVS